MDYNDRSQFVPQKADGKLQSNAPFVPQTNTIPPRDDNSAIFIVFSFILAVFLMTAPFLKTLSFKNEKGSISELIESFRYLLHWVYDDDLEALKAMLSAGGGASYVAGSYILAVVLYIAMALELIITLVYIGNNDIRSFWKSMVVFAGVALLIETIALSWVEIINNDSLFDDARMEYTGLFPLYVMAAIVLLIIAVVNRRNCSQVGEAIPGPVYYRTASETPWGESYNKVDMMPAPEHYKTCPMCGATHGINSKYCTKCGSMLDPEIGRK